MSVSPQGAEESYLTVFPESRIDLLLIQIAMRDRTVNMRLCYAIVLRVENGRCPKGGDSGKRSILYCGIRCEDRIGFQPIRNTTACLQFDHAQPFESTTDSRYSCTANLTGNAVK